MMINKEIMFAFFANNRNENVGQNKFTGRETTLFEEIGELGRMVFKAYTDEDINYYKASAAYNKVELTKEELEAHIKNNYRRAAKKIVFLNGVCKKLEGQSFLTVFADTEDDEQNIKLVTEMVRVLREKM